MAFETMVPVASIMRGISFLSTTIVVTVVGPPALSDAGKK
jgi:hypothetical protein